MSVFEDFYNARKEIIRKNRELQKLGIQKKEAREKTIEEYHGIYYRFLQHPAIKGYTKTISTLMDRVDFLWKQNISLTKQISSPHIPPHYKCYEFEFIYSSSGKQNIPSQKNSLRPTIVKKNGKRFTSLRNSTKTTDFRADLELEWMRRMDCQPYIKHCHVELTLYYGNFKTTDGDGKVTSIFDALKICGLFQDDSWLNIGSFNVTNIYRKGKAGFLIKVYEMDRDEFMKQRQVPKEQYNKKGIKW